MNISKTNGSIATKFYLKHHLGGGLAALGFKPDLIRTLVSMATESSHRVIMVKTVSPLLNEKTGLLGFRPGPTQTGLYSHRRWLEV